jgi:CheY-like chemotaxis protein
MPKTILIVDDEPGYRMMMEFELSQEGYRVLAAGSGKEALDTLKKEKVDLVITDMKMPAMDGLDMALAARKNDPRLPIILMTGYAEDRVWKAKELNIPSLHKPFHLKELRKLIDSSLLPD